VPIKGLNEDEGSHRSSVLHDGFPHLLLMLVTKTSLVVSLETRAVNVTSLSGRFDDCCRMREHSQYNVLRSLRCRRKGKVHCQLTVLSERTPLERCCVHNMSPFVSSSGLSPGSREDKVQRAKV